MWRTFQWQYTQDREFRGSILQAAQNPASKGHGRSLVVLCVWATQQAGGIAGVCKDFTHTPVRKALPVPLGSLLYQ